MPKFFVKDDQIKNNKIEIIDEDVNHIVNVLRCKIGENLNIANIDTGKNYESEIEKIDKNSVICKIKREIENQDKIDVRLFTKDYKNEYTSWDINRKVSELILRRKLTDVQYRDLQSEIGIYNFCKQVISRKDIKRLKNKDGSTRYYVLINGEEYADPYFKKLKFGKKFLSSRRYEIKEEAIANLKENKFKYNLIVDFNKVTCPIVEKSSKKVVEDVER